MSTCSSDNSGPSVFYLSQSTILLLSVCLSLHLSMLLNILYLPSLQPLFLATVINPHTQWLMYYTHHHIRNYHPASASATNNARARNSESEKRVGNKCVYGPEMECTHPRPEEPGLEQFLLPGIQCRLEVVHLGRCDRSPCVCPLVSLLLLLLA